LALVEELASTNELVALLQGLVSVYVLVVLPGAGVGACCLGGAVQIQVVFVSGPPQSKHVWQGNILAKAKGTHVSYSSQLELG
jgi:hypothetical protein